MRHPRSSHQGRIKAWLVAASVLTAAAARADVVTLAPVKDNTLIEDPTGAASNGAGPFLFIGRTRNHGRRRAILAFDIAGNVPARASIDSVTLTLTMNSPQVHGEQSYELRRVLADWGEGTSSSTGGAGSLSTPGDATWIHTFFDRTSWATPGGDFSPTVSASRNVGGSVGLAYTWGPAAQMAADVQRWLDDASTNFGWIVLGGEGDITAKRLESRESTTAALRPKLIIDFTPVDAVEPRTWTRVKALYRD